MSAGESERERDLNMFAFTHTCTNTQPAENFGEVEDDELPEDDGDRRAVDLIRQDPDVEGLGFRV